MHHTLTNGTCTTEDTKLESAYMHHSPQLIPFTTQYNLRTLLSATYGSCNYAPLPSCTRPRAHRTADTPLIRLYTLIITALGVLVGLPVSLGREYRQHETANSTLLCSWCETRTLLANYDNWAWTLNDQVRHNYSGGYAYTYSSRKTITQLPGKCYNHVQPQQ